MTNKRQPWEGSRAKDVYDYLCQYYWDHGVVPSYTNVCMQFNIGTSVYTYYLDQMEEMYLIERIPKHASSRYRDIMLVGALHLPPPASRPTFDQVKKMEQQFKNWIVEVGERNIGESLMSGEYDVSKAQNNPHQIKEPH